MAEASQRPDMVDDQYRGLLTEREREIIKGEADVSDNYRYRVVSRVRTKIENVGEDVEILAENRDDLLEELRNVICREDRRISIQLDDELLRLTFDERMEVVGVNRGGCS